MAGKEILNLFQGDTTVALAVELKNGDWVPCGETYWRNMALISAYFYLDDGEPHMELTLKYAIGRPDKRAIATLRLDRCKSLDCFLGRPYDLNGLEASSPKLRFWHEQMNVFLPSVEQCRKAQVRYVALSLRGVPALKFVKVDLDKMQPDTASETVLEVLSAGTEKNVEILFAYGKEDMMGRPIHSNIEHFMSRCREIGASKAKMQAAAAQNTAAQSNAVSTISVTNDTGLNVPQPVQSTLKGTGEDEAMHQARESAARFHRRGGYAGDWRGGSRGGGHMADRRDSGLPQTANMFQHQGVKRKNVETSPNKAKSTKTRRDSRAPTPVAETTTIDLTGSDDEVEAEVPAEIEQKPRTRAERTEQTLLAIGVKEAQKKIMDGMKEIATGNWDKPQVTSRNFDKATARMVELGKELASLEEEKARLKADWR